MPAKFPMPPVEKNTDGNLRRVGVELEMNGLTLDQLAHLAADFLDCKVEQTSRYERTLVGDDAGDWVVEFDFRLLKKLGREERKKHDLGDELMNSAEDALKWVSEGLVPMELVSPPLPLDRLGHVDDLIDHLRRAGAKGTGDRITNAFGMQFNPEVPDCEADTITAYLKAFLCLYDWIKTRADINITRRISGYVDPFPKDYVRKVIDTDYWPPMNDLIDDYLVDNPTRNRALDMLPLFKHIDEKRVLAKAGDVLIKQRPTFHYRLPDCLIDQSGWGLHVAWKDWLQVEYLAHDRKRLQACCEAYGEYWDQSIGGRLLDKWEHRLNRDWLCEIK